MNSKMINDSVKETYWAQLLIYNIMIASDESNKGTTVYICSPLRAETQEEVDKNMYATRAYMKYLFLKLGLNAFAPHAFLPYLLDDRHEDERELALNLGLKMLDKCKILCVCGDRISDGMKGEIREACRLGLDIYVYNRNLYRDVLELVPGANVFKKEDAGYLALSADGVIEADKKGA